MYNKLSLSDGCENILTGVGIPVYFRVLKLCLHNLTTPLPQICFSITVRICMGSSSVFFQALKGGKSPP